MFRLFFCNRLCLLLFTIKLLYLLLLFYRQRYLRIGKTANLLRSNSVLPLKSRNQILAKYGYLRNFPIGNYLSIFSLDDDLVSKAFGFFVLNIHF